MAKYKIITIAVNLKNRIANFGEVVDGSELTLNAEEMIAGGFIELTESDEVADVSVNDIETEIEEVEGTQEESDEVIVEEKKHFSAKDKVKSSLTNKK